MLLRNKFRFTAELDQGSFDLLSICSLNLAAALCFSILCSLCSQEPRALLLSNSSNNT